MEESNVVVFVQEKEIIYVFVRKNGMGGWSEAERREEVGTDRER